MELLPKVACPSVKMHPIGPCDNSTGRQAIELIKYEFKDCKCHPIGRIAKDRPCSKSIVRFISTVTVLIS